MAGLDEWSPPTKGNRGWNRTRLIDYSDGDHFLPSVPVPVPVPAMCLGPGPHGLGLRVVPTIPVLKHPEPRLVLTVDHE